jgi:hypothetical protein
MTEPQFLHECHLHLPLWKCLEMGCKARYDEIQRRINESELSPEGKETKEVLEALYLLSTYFPDNPVFDCTETMPATHEPPTHFQRN